jgi:glycerol-3-phosphate dehydrogenase (NAD(P)+)
VSGRIAIAGAGAFGTALALVALRAGAEVALWGRDPARMRTMAASRENPHLPGAAIPDAVELGSDPKLFGSADLVLVAVPAQETRAAVTTLAGAIRAGVPAVACAKGIEQATGLLQTDVLSEILPRNPAAALSGPGFAAEIARGLPTAVTIAAADIALAHRIAATLSSERFRPYASADLVGVEFAGAAKNVLAIACGIVAGRGLGESARAALIARGLAEMMRLGAALGARPETFMGLAGLGDLVLTAASEKSRNTAFGVELGRGRGVAELLTSGRPLAEGAHTARITAELARRHGVDAPVIAAVAAIIDGSLSVDAAIEGLVSRPLKAEND